MKAGINKTIYLSLETQELIEKHFTKGENLSRILKALVMLYDMENEMEKEKL